MKVTQDLLTIESISKIVLLYALTSMKITKEAAGARLVLTPPQTYG